MPDITDTGLPRAVTIAWGMQEVPQRGPTRGLSHEQIVRAAIAIADEEGLAAVTMQAVAKSLGFTTMSLYRYVSSKDELLRLMLDAASQLPAKISLPTQWQAALRIWARLIRDVYRAHPWLLHIPRDQTSVLMPNAVRTADLGLAAMAGLQLSDDEKVGSILVLSQHAASSVELERSLADEGQVAVSGEGLELLGEVITDARFPHLAPLMRSGNYVSSEEPAIGDADTPEFLHGLDLIIGGLELMETRRTGNT